MVGYTVGSGRIKITIFLLAMKVGLAHMVQMVVDDKEANHHFIGGFSKLGDSGVKEYIAVLALCARPLEAVAVELLRDDRFLKRAAELKQIMDDTIKVVESTPSLVYMAVCELLVPSWSWESLRNVVIRSMYNGVCYFYRESFALLQIGFFELTQGCIADNVRELCKNADAGHLLDAEM